MGGIRTAAILKLILVWSTVLRAQDTEPPVLQAQDTEPPVLLFQPNISISSSMDGVSQEQQQGLQVFRGHNFTISCSIQTQYPGGQFTVTFTGVNQTHNQTHNQTQPAANHTAHFLFVAADDAHRGNYSCVYDVYNVSSESELLSLGVADYVRLVDGDNRCTGKLELKHQGTWRLLDYAFSGWSMTSAAVVCRQLGCGSVGSTRWSLVMEDRYQWNFSPRPCERTDTALRACGKVVNTKASFSRIQVTCSEFVRLVNGSGLCSGRVEVKSERSWASVREADLDWQDAEVVCRELGCGAPSVLRGALHGNPEAPVWIQEFQCGGGESRLVDCATSNSTRTVGSRGRAVGLTCSEPADVSLAAGGSRCAGTVQLKFNNESRPLYYGGSVWSMKSAAVLCRQLNCGAAISTTTDRNATLVRTPVWEFMLYCFGPESVLRECGAVVDFPQTSRRSVTVLCEDVLFQPNISISSPTDGLSQEQQQQGLQVLRGHNFTISCSIQPQYPGGQFSVIFTGVNQSTHNQTLNQTLNQTHNQTLNQTQPAVNHSAHFLFGAADDAHRGNYSCVYSVTVLKHDFSSESDRLFLTVGTSLVPGFILRVMGLVALVLTTSGTVLCLRCKASRGRQPAGEQQVEVEYYNLDGGVVSLHPAERGQAAESHD